MTNIKKMGRPFIGALRNHKKKSTMPSSSWLSAATTRLVQQDKFGVAMPAYTIKPVKKNRAVPGLTAAPVIHYNLNYAALCERERLDDGLIPTAQGAVAVDTGIFTGRSPKDKYFVDESSSRHNIWWGEVNKAVPESIFNKLYQRVRDHLSSQAEVFVIDGYAGADPHTSMPLRVITAKAWQAHFCKNMFIRPEDRGEKVTLESFAPEFTIYNASDLKNTEFEHDGMNSENFVIFHLGRRIAIIGGTAYAGEMKKGIFSVMNYTKPLEGILSMHCAANLGKEYNDVALFFGLSGTGKTTLSTDGKRLLIGDDEHLWDDHGIANIEGGCYAKTIDIDPKKEPDIYKAIKRNALLENVQVDPISRQVDYSSRKKTENSRVSYPLSHVERRVESGIAGHPSKIIFLTCDAFGVLPPVAKLTPDQAAYHFLSGYTSKAVGTERDIKTPTATFSACYGQAFLPLHPTVYAKLLTQKILRHNVQAFLVNTGWSGGQYGVGKRMDITLTRRIVDAIFSDHALSHDDFTHHPVLNLHVPNLLKGPDFADITTDLLHPWQAWNDRDQYERQVQGLASMFINNFKQYDAIELTQHGPQFLE
eukprot:CAMPEP_0197286724 /NCGR_PEP_ID=MMETSP0890-20130614/2326_1 /TAXON_ID=44058 ORGANISM="Aureoumbra lagunensis, Strain CCMP1510" /NCGR_SAMPLE_ID=MMETSP0890 /ASSEMBLY_ACC=CAM_ASM_000533 /LENGTH=590 /DNA_ID=CAMNT_0042755387 /DNA_START=51 /DNA_END=1823 /DNA_ORIENTATION=+